MMAHCKEDGQWRDKKMEGGEGLKTLECLRGRLLAERQTSRSAKEEAEIMGKKLIELENQIRKETELRKKSEKKLKLLMKKLKSLDITLKSVTSEKSNLSEITTNSSSSTKESEEQELKSQNLVSTMTENHGQKVPSSTSFKQYSRNLTIEDENHQNALNRSNSSPRHEFPQISCTNLHQTSEISQLKNQSLIVKANERENKHYKEIQLTSFRETSLAANSETGEMKTMLKPAHGRVTEALDALKHISQTNQSSFERIHNMKAIVSI